MTNSQQPAFPLEEHKDSTSAFLGLTKREYAAIMAMQGLLASQEHKNMPDFDEKEHVAEYAVLFVDALLTELEKPTT